MSPTAFLYLALVCLGHFQMSSARGSSSGTGTACSLPYCARVDSTCNNCDMCYSGYAPCSGDCTVSPSTYPLITGSCPSNILLPALGKTKLKVTFPQPTATATCGAATVQCMPASGSDFMVDSPTNVICTATDTATDNENSCPVFTVTLDAAAPVIKCPYSRTVAPNILANAMANVSLSVNATDNVAVKNISCNGAFNSIVTNGYYVFPLGSSTVQCIAFDTAGSSSTCIFVVNNVDPTPPVIKCPYSRTVAPNNFINALVNISVSVNATDNVAVKNISCNGAYNSIVTNGYYMFPLGSSRVQCIAFDTAGNNNTCNFTINNVDTTPPSIQCGAARQLTPMSGYPFVVWSTYATPAVSDAAGIANSSCTPEPSFQNPVIFPLGVSYVNCSATDSAGLSSWCLVVVNVTDTIPPLFTSCPSSFSYTTLPTDNRPNPIVNFNSYVNATDNSGIRSLVCPTSGLPIFYVSTTTTVACTATDKAGNTNFCSFPLSIIDNAPPVLTCPSIISVSPTNGVNASVVVPFSVSSSDNSGILSQSCNVSSPLITALGTTYVGCTATDNDNKVTTCAFPITSTDVTLPTLTCPPYTATLPLSLTPTNGNTPTVTASWAFAAVDNSGLANSGCTFASGSTFGLGTNPVACSATDNAGNSNSCPVFNVVVTDNTPPSFTCPSNQNLKLTGSTTTLQTIYNISSSATDGSGIKNTSCTPPSGSSFESGTTLVTCTAFDNALNSKSCSFFVTVSSHDAPVINCPGNIVTQPSGGQPTASVSYTVTASDSTLVAPTVTCSANSPSTFPLGVSLISCNATNQFSLQTRCSFTVSVIDTVVPTISCPANINASPDAGKTYATAIFANPTASDNSGIASLSCSPTSGSKFPVAVSTLVTCTATDGAMLQNACAFTVSVADNIPPVVTCPSDQTISTAVTSLTSVSYPQATATDNSGIPSVVCSPASGTLFGLGYSKVTCTATDTSGNVASCNFNVRVADLLPPVITCQTNLTISTSPNAATGVTNWNLATATDNSNGAVVISCPQFGITTFPVGVTLLSCTATDTSNNVASCSFTVTVVDTQPPEVSCPTNIYDVLGPGRSNKTEIWSFTASDNVGVRQQYCNPSSGSVLQWGQTVVNCFAFDAAGNNATCSFLLTLADTQAPTVICPPAYIGQTAPNISTGIIEWQPPSPSAGTAFDNVGISLVVCTIPLTQTIFPLGQTSVTCTAFDPSYNSAQCTFAVTILDKQPPTVSCPADQSGGLEQTDPSTSLFLNFGLLIPPTDNVDYVSTGTLQVLFQVNGIATSVFSNWAQVSIGRTFFTYFAVDSSGNSASCTFTGTVLRQGGTLDTMPPIVNCPPQLLFYFNTDPGKPSAIATWPTITATDNIGITSQQYITNPAGLYNGAAFPVGNSTVRFIASDDAGNFAQCNFGIVVKDAEPPRATCPYSFVQNCNPPFRSANVTWLTPAFTDNVGILTSTVSRYPGNYAAGTYEVTASAVDLIGNTASCSFTFTVVTDTLPPMVVCPLSQTVSTNPGKAYALVSWDPPTIADSGGITSAIYTPSQYYPPAAFPVTTTAIKFTVSDLFLNMKVCNFKITVQDKEPPTISCPLGFSVQIPTGSTKVLVSWQTPIAYDNVQVDSIIHSRQPMTNYTAGVYLVYAYANDTSGNISPNCNFTFTVIAPAASITNGNAASSASSSSSSAAAAAAGGGAGGFILIVLIAVAVWARRKRDQVRKLEEQYGHSDMSDEAVLARAQAIQQAFQNKKRNATPNMKWLAFPPISFQPPPKDLRQMSAYLSAFMDMELARSSVVIESEIGAGEFGSVCSGHYKRPDGSKRTIAIKTLKDSTNIQSKVKFLQEASIMIQFKHPKIVALVGVVTKTEPALICLEFMELGSLRTYLKSEFVQGQLTDADIIRMACDVCSAMHYLGESGFVHRDLAARNVLINKDLVCKVCDFGLSQETGEDNSNDKAEKIPIRWTAPEAIMHAKFSTASDVWSFGILMWEMWSYGAMPYKGWTNEVVTAQVMKGYRMPNPKNCPSFVHNLMMECWNEQSRDRPSFYDAFEKLLAFWTICKPMTYGTKPAYEYDGRNERQRQDAAYSRPNKGQKSQQMAADNGSQDSALGGHVARNNPTYADDDDADAYDLGGDGGKVKARDVIANRDDDDDADAYDLGGAGGKVKARDVIANRDDDEDGDAYDLGGSGGKVRARDVIANRDDNDADTYDLGGAGGKVKARDIVDIDEDHTVRGHHSSHLHDDDDDAEYDLGGAGGKVTAAAVLGDVEDDVEVITRGGTIVPVSHASAMKLQAFEEDDLMGEAQLLSDRYGFRNDGGESDEDDDDDVLAAADAHEGYLQVEDDSDEDDDDDE